MTCPKCGCQLKWDDGAYCKSCAALPSVQRGSNSDWLKEDWSGALREAGKRNGITERVDSGYIAALKKKMDDALKAQEQAYERWYFKANERIDAMCDCCGDECVQCDCEDCRSDADPEVHRPSHYTYGKIECWDVVDDWGLDYYLGTVLKYICRAGHKGDKKTDLRKAREFLDRAISKLP